MKRMLMATDNSHAAIGATQLAAALAKGGATDVVVMSVAETPAREDQTSTIARDAAEKAVDDAVNIFETRGVDCRRLVASGTPAVSILDAAETLAVDVVVMGRRGLDPVRRFLLGSVSDEVARGAICSVLLGTEIPPPEMGVGTVVVAIDGSTDAFAAAALACDIASQQDANVVLLHVVQALNPAVREHLSEAVEDRLPEDDIARLALKNAADALEAKDISYEVVIRRGPAHSRILELAESTNAGLIAVGHRGLGATRRMLLGSVSDKVVRNTERPVLLGSAPAAGP